MFKKENVTLWVKANQYEILLGLIAVFLTYIIAMKTKKSRSNFPPGPMGFPIVGYIPFLTKDLHVDLMKLGEKYGDVFSLKFGSQDMVILHGAEVIKESLNKRSLLGRPPNIEIAKLGQSSIVLGQNISLWKEQRKFMVKSMNEIGLGKTKIEEDIMDEINHFIAVLRKQNAQPKDVKEALAASISNNICALIFGKRFEYNDPTCQFLVKNIDDFFEHAAQASLELAFPWLRYIPLASKILDNHKAKTVLENLHFILNKEMNDHIKTINHEAVRDYIDRYLVEIEAQGTKNQNTSFNHNMLINSAMDLFFGGSETIQTSILWFFYILAAFPDVQKNVQKEIIDKIGSEKRIEFKDMKNMPYTHAVLLETLRWKTPVPLSILHYTLDDLIVGGYHLPKGTIVAPNLWAVHHDPKHWNDPEKMDPERFLSEDCKSVLKPDYFIPFSLGRRGCPGESMAYMEMFLYCTTILREFDIAFPEGVEPSFDATFSIVYRLKPYLLRFIPKN